MKTIAISPATMEALHPTMGPPGADTPVLEFATTGPQGFSATSCEVDPGDGPALHAHRKTEEIFLVPPAVGEQVKALAGQATYDLLQGAGVRFDAGVEAPQVTAVAAGFVTLVAALHVYFLVLEMFLWQTPYGMKTFGSTPEFAAASAVLAANQGLYNGFLAAGLLWALLRYGVVGGRHILTFFLLCVLVAASYGGATVHPRILLVQGLPALIALATVWRARE